MNILRKHSKLYYKETQPTHFFIVHVPPGIMHLLLIGRRCNLVGGDEIDINFDEVLNRD